MKTLLVGPVKTRGRVVKNSTKTPLYFIAKHIMDSCTR